MKLALIGFGNVGQGFAEILQDKADELMRRHGFQASIVAVATRHHGTLVKADGLDIGALLAAARQGDLAYYPDAPNLQRDWSAERIAHESTADVLIEVSVTDLQSGQPAIHLIQTALNAAKHVVTANKGPLALACAELVSLARQRGRAFRYEATVMAGTPAIQMTLESLSGCRIHRARGILNGTTNYILTQMEAGATYEVALAQAQAMGYAEADPRGDVEGWDAAGKARILASILFGAQPDTPLETSGITHLTPDHIAEARAHNQRYKLIATVTPDEGRVAATPLSLDDPLAHVSGATNALTLETDLLGAITLIGPGAGRKETGAAILNDLLAIHRVTRL